MYLNVICEFSFTPAIVALSFVDAFFRDEFPMHALVESRDRQALRALDHQENIDQGTGYIPSLNYAFNLITYRHGFQALEKRHLGSL